MKLQFKETNQQRIINKFVAETIINFNYYVQINVIANYSGAYGI